MGLRINNNVNANNALRNLRQADRLQSTSLERLSSGLRINRASDDPAGLVISEQFRSQIGGIEQALENTQFSQNLISTTEAALQEVSDLLIKVRESAIFAKNSGGTSSEQLSAEQDAVDSAVSAISRIANSTRYGRVNLLNGSSDFVTSGVSGGITDMQLRSVYFGNQNQAVFTAVVTASAQRATLTAGNFAAAGGTLRVTGALGTEDVTISSSITTAAVVSAINKVRDFTGVYGSGNLVFSEEFGSDELVRVDVVTGTFTGTTGIDNGVDVGINLDATTVQSDGLHVRFNSKFLKGEFSFNAAAADGSVALTSHTLGVRESGLTFQLGNEALATDQITIGVHSIDPLNLGGQAVARPAGGGTVGGFLDSLVSGGANDLTTQPGNAIKILDEALDQVNGLRAFLGAISKDTLDPNTRSLSVALENIVASESSIRDLDFASETAEFTRAQILFAAGTSILASANLVPQTVLSLLQ
jgi:flagellin